MHLFEIIKSKLHSLFNYNVPNETLRIGVVRCHVSNCIQKFQSYFEAEIHGETANTNHSSKIDISHNRHLANAIRRRAPAAA